MIPWLPPSYRALVIAPGAIGSAIARIIEQDEACAQLFVAGRGRELPVDVAQEASIAALFDALDGPLHLVIYAGGLLHDAGMQPEKALREVRADAMERSYRINAIAPALIAKHAERLMPKNEAACFAVLGARVGSITDNRLGGWYAYRMAKAAAAQFIRTLAIEWQRTRPMASALLLHPGTVDSALSRPFQRNVPPERLFTPERSARVLVEVIAAAGPERSGEHIAWDGETIPA